MENIKFIKSKGEVTYPVDGLQMDVPLNVNGISPSNGSLGGGTTLTITGTGFSPDLLGSSLAVSIDNRECILQTMNSNEITCLTPSATNESTFDIIVALNNKTTSFYGFTYDARITPIVTNMDPIISPSPLGGDLLTITGTAFGSLAGTVKLCGKECPIMTWNNTEIQCILPANPDGLCPAIIEVPGNGFAGVQHVAPISYKFRLTGISPNLGSLLGGTELTITGEGFTNDNCTNVTVKLGEGYTCEVKDCGNTFLICETKRQTEIKYIRNLGIHPTYGFGYRWHPIKTKIHPGDKVVWQWSLGSASQDKGINIFQTASTGKILTQN